HLTTGPTTTLTFTLIPARGSGDYSPNLLALIRGWYNARPITQRAAHAAHPPRPRPPRRARRHIVGVQPRRLVPNPASPLGTGPPSELRLRTAAGHVPHHRAR